MSTASAAQIAAFTKAMQAAGVSMEQAAEAMGWWVSDGQEACSHAEQTADCHWSGKRRERQPMGVVTATGVSDEEAEQLREAFMRAVQKQPGGRP